MQKWQGGTKSEADHSGRSLENLLKRAGSEAQRPVRRRGVAGPWGRDDNGLGQRGAGMEASEARLQRWFEGRGGRLC